MDAHCLLEIFNIFQAKVVKEGMRCIEILSFVKLILELYTRDIWDNINQSFIVYHICSFAPLKIVFCFIEWHE
jgi:hypothetical protein